MLCSAFECLSSYFLFCIYIVISTSPPGLCLFPFLFILPSLRLFYECVLSKYCCSLIPVFSGIPSGPILSDEKYKGGQRERMGWMGGKWGSSLVVWNNLGKGEWGKKRRMLSTEGKEEERGYQGISRIKWGRKDGRREGKEWKAGLWKVEGWRKEQAKQECMSEWMCMVKKKKKEWEGAINMRKKEEETVDKNGKSEWKITKWREEIVNEKN